MNSEDIAVDLLRAFRGARSQNAFSRHLGYRSNIVHRWENRRCWPTASTALRIFRRGVDIRQALQRFFDREGPWLEGDDPTSPEGVAFWLSHLRGTTPIQSIAQDSGYSRFAISRWLKGTAEPRLPELLTLVDVMSLRLLDFLAVLVDPMTLPSVREDWRRLQAGRDAAFSRPWSHAVLRAVELEPYRRLAEHEPGWIAARLGIDAAEEARCLELLEHAGQLRWKKGRWNVQDTGTVDLRVEKRRINELKAFWLEVAKTRLQQGHDGIFGFNLFAVSQRDLDELHQMHVEHFQRMRARIARSQPSEAVALFSTQLLRLDDSTPDAG